MPHTHTHKKKKKTVAPPIQSNQKNMQIHKIQRNKTSRTHTPTHPPHTHTHTRTSIQHDTTKQTMYVLKTAKDKNKEENTLML